MNQIVSKACIAFEGHRCVAKGEIRHVAEEVKKLLDTLPESIVTVFDTVSSRIVELDLRGSVEDLRQRLAAQEEEQIQAAAQAEKEHRGPGRPKLGVVSREVGLLPRHWEWLRVQPGGASAALRRLIEEARKNSRGKDAVRAAQESAYRFMSTMAGDLPGYEEALRALYAKDSARFEQCIAGWPEDVRRHSTELAAAALSA